MRLKKQKTISKETLLLGDRGKFFQCRLNQNLNYPESGSRLIFIDGKKDKIGEDGGNLLLETNDKVMPKLCDKLSLEEATSGISCKK